MVVLDRVESLLARDVVHFDERPVREYCENHPLKVGKVEVDWSVKKIVNAIDRNVIMGCSVGLSEDHPNARLTSVCISGIDKDSLLVKPDHFSVRYYKEGTYNKSCDYILFTKFNGVRYAIFMDLKTKIYETPNGNVFSFRNDMDKAIVWQMIGADALADGIIDRISKKGATRHGTVIQYKKNAGWSELAKFKRRYLILYRDEDCTGNLMPRHIQEPNIASLEKTVHVMKVADGDTVPLGDMFSVGGLEA